MGCGMALNYSTESQFIQNNYMEGSGSAQEILNYLIILSESYRTFHL